MRALVLLLTLLVAAPALAQDAQTAEPPEPAQPVLTAEPGSFGTLELLRDRTGGSLIVVRKQSREVEVVRAGQAMPAVPGMAIQLGDAVRCGTGVAAIATLDGGRVEIGERSQVRIDSGRLTMRLGDVFVETPTSMDVVVGDSSITVEAGAARVTSSLQLEGLVQSVDGAVRVVSGDAERRLDPGQSTEVNIGDGAVKTLTADEVAAVVAPREHFVLPEKAPLANPDRVHILFAGGLGLVDRSEWGQVDLSARVRIGGPVWVAFGAGLTIRPAEELPGYSTVLALPVRLGVRFVAQLPRSAYLHGGADLTVLLGERCTSLDGCPRVFSAEPGGIIALGAGVHIHERLGLQFELGGGLYRRRTPPPAPGLADLVFPEFQLHALVGVFLRI